MRRIWVFLILGSLFIFALIAVPRKEQSPQNETPPQADIAPRDQKPDTGRSRRDYSSALESFISEARQVDPDRTVFEKIEFDGRWLVVSISDEWYSLPGYQKERLAEDVWRMWAAKSSPGDLDAARIRLIDSYGKELASSSTLAGSIVNVKQ